MEVEMHIHILKMIPNSAIPSDQKNSIRKLWTHWEQSRPNEKTRIPRNKAHYIKQSKPITKLTHKSLGDTCPGTKNMEVNWKLHHAGAIIGL